MASDTKSQRENQVLQFNQQDGENENITEGSSELGRYTAQLNIHTTKDITLSQTISTSSTFHVCLWRCTSLFPSPS